MQQQRRIAAILLTALVGLSACSESATGPSETPHDIVVTLDWPLVREPGLSDAIWRLERITRVGANEVVDQGDFASDGTAILAFRVTCSESGFASTGHVIELTGRLASNQWVCSQFSVSCTQDPQHRTFESHFECHAPEN
jgi:hypothetical protein